MTALEHNAPPRAFREFGIGLSGYLKRHGVAVMLTTTLETLTGGESATGVALSSVADSIITLRYVDDAGQLRRGILVIKLRGQKHERAIHEYDITDRGIRILQPFTGIAGILSGRASISRDRDPTTVPAHGAGGSPQT